MNKKEFAKKCVEIVEGFRDELEDFPNLNELLDIDISKRMENEFQKLFDKLIKEQHEFLMKYMN